MLHTRSSLSRTYGTYRLTALQRQQTRNVSVGGMKDLSVGEVFKLHQAGVHPYLDVRTPEEFVQGHASGAVNVPVMLRGTFGMAANPSFVAEVKKTFPDCDQTIMVGCKSGARSMAAINALSQDYPNLINVSSGFDGWVASGLPVHK